MSTQDPLASPKLGALPGLPFAADDLADTFQLLRHALIRCGDFVEGVCDFALDAQIIAAHAHGEVAGPHGLQRLQQVLVGIGIAVWLATAVFTTRTRCRTDVSHEISLRAGRPESLRSDEPVRSIRTELESYQARRLAKVKYPMEPRGCFKVPRLRELFCQSKPSCDSDKKSHKVPITLLHDELA